MFVSRLFIMRVLVLLLVFTFSIPMHIHAMDAANMGAFARVDQRVNQMCDQAGNVCCKTATNMALVGGMGATIWVGIVSGTWCGLTALCAAQNVCFGNPLPGHDPAREAFICLGICGVSGALTVASFKACRALKRNINCCLVLDNVAHEE